jgi:vancomycin permeability regulator SanA
MPIDKGLTQNSIIYNIKKLFYTNNYISNINELRDFKFRKGLLVQGDTTIFKYDTLNDNLIERIERAIDQYHQEKLAKKYQHNNKI